MTINTSEFFRNPMNYKHLQEVLFPKIFAEKQKVKIWSAASSNGCEVYTVSIILKELGISPNRYELKATDIDPSIIEEAKEGLYSTNCLKRVPKDILNKYFTKKDKYYQLDKRLWLL